MRIHLARPLSLIALMLLVAASPTTPRFRGGRNGEKPIVLDCLPVEDLRVLAGPVVTSEPAARAPAAAKWSLMSTDGPGVVTPALVHDPDARRVVMIGGGGAGLSNGVWTLPLAGEATWSLLATSGTPPSPRRSLAAIIDPIRHRAIVYGGYDGSFLADLWQLTLGVEPRWSRLEARGAAPPALAASAAVYDSKRDRMILIQGNDGVAPVFRNRGVWALELSGSLRWTALSPAGTAPAPRSAHTAVYDSKEDRVLVFGGSTPQLSNELWALDLEGNGAWRRLAFEGPWPVTREEHSAIFDRETETMILYGGVGPGTDYGRNHVLALHDAWALSLGERSAWRPLGDAIDPLGRWGHRAIFDPVGRRMIVSGGWGAIGTTIALSLGPVAAPRPALEHRRALTSPMVAPMPTGLPLQLAMRAASPTRGPLALRLALPAAEGARLELFDVEGRRLAARDLSDLGAGFVRYRWDATARLPAGVYMLRLSGTKEIVNTKVIVLR